ncbi:TRAP transporter substrate-binding protein DctP [uncultured Ruegeria sp.]|uniref:TRAP transporter substrate-binding protein DctP n=1 Tax=uncultured Ruegeria sp. TaxID=259304 RepID=UPI00260422FD|nr:TRAP transporter substrate-binding protein DctP [uncultured Ruegeria sp.]
MKIANLVAAGFICVAPSITTAQEYQLSVSLESPNGHVRNQTFELYAERVAKASDGRVEIKVFGSASQYSGAAVPAALAQGAIDMGAPLYLHLSRFVPEAQFADLPMAYGANEDQIYSVIDGEFGTALHEKIEDTLGVVVLGRPFGVGHAVVYTTETPIRSPADMEGLKLRVPGGAANVERFNVFGANPVSIPWPDAPQALQRGTVDGMLSTDEPVRSVSLWDSGLSYVFVDGQSYFMYVPLISGQAWNTLPEDVQAILVDTWDDLIVEARGNANKRWNTARQINAQNGIEVIEPDPADLEKMRAQLMAIQPELIETLEIDPEMIGLAQAGFEG